MKHKEKKRSAFMTFFIILMAVTALLCTTAFGLWMYGRQTFTAHVVAPKLPPAQTETAEPSAEESDTAATEPAAVPEQFTVHYQGTEYRYNEDMVNILLLGIDSDNKPSEPLPYGSDIQADAILLAALDLKNKDMTLLSINRDTMTNIEIRDPSGESLGYSRSQLALSYAFGDGLEESCRMTCEAVSNLFYGLQIHGYGTYYMGGICDLNDALGGVTVTILDDYPFTNMSGMFSEMTAGTTMTLNGKQAEAYVRCRLDTETGNSLRMVRQKQYVLAMLSQTLDQVRQSPGKVFPLFDSLDDYILTDLDLSEISYLATQATSLAFNGEIRSLTGEMILSEENHMELTLDQEALYETILDVFYEKAT